MPEPVGLVVPPRRTVICDEVGHATSVSGRRGRPAERSWKTRKPTTASRTIAASPATHTHGLVPVVLVADVIEGAASPAAPSRSPA